MGGFAASLLPGDYSIGRVGSYIMETIVSSWHLGRPSNYPHGLPRVTSSHGASQPGVSKVDQASWQVPKL